MGVVLVARAIVTKNKRNIKPKLLKKLTYRIKFTCSSNSKIKWSLFHSINSLQMPMPKV